MQYQLIWQKHILFMKTELYMQVDLKHMHQEPGNNVVTMGIDLTEFYLSVE